MAWPKNEIFVAGTIVGEPQQTESGHDITIEVPIGQRVSRFVVGLSASKAEFVKIGMYAPGRQAVMFGRLMGVELLNSSDGTPEAYARLATAIVDTRKPEEAMGPRVSLTFEGNVGKNITEFPSKTGGKDRTSFGVCNNGPNGFSLWVEVTLFSGGIGDNIRAGLIPGLGLYASGPVIAEKFQTKAGGDAAKLRIAPDQVGITLTNQRLVANGVERVARTARQETTIA